MSIKNFPDYKLISIKEKDSDEIKKVKLRIDNCLNKYKLIRFIFIPFSPYAHSSGHKKKLS